eukprot:10524272-Heterocapsa_arctica.AAC.1
MEEAVDIIKMSRDNKKEIDKMTGKELVGYWADFMQSKPKIKKSLGHLGAGRIHRNRAKAMVDGKEAPNNYSIILFEDHDAEGRDEVRVHPLPGHRQLYLLKMARQYEGDEEA